jgi:hypothetical protein
MMPLTSRETFDILSQDGKLGVLYDSLDSLHSKMNDFCKNTTDNIKATQKLIAENKEEDSNRITNLGITFKAKIDLLDRKFERRKKFNTTLAGTMGLVGGVIAHLAERIIKF